MVLCALDRKRTLLVACIVSVFQPILVANAICKSNSVHERLIAVAIIIPLSVMHAVHAVVFCYT